LENGRGRLVSDAIHSNVFQQACYEYEKGDEMRKGVAFSLGRISTTFITIIML